MSVEVRGQPAEPAAPQRRSTPPAYAEERVHTGVFWLAVASLVIAALVIGVSRAWAAQSQKMVTLPLFDQTAVMSGHVTFHVDPDTLVLLQTPQVTSFQDSRRTQTPGQLHTRLLMLSVDTITVGGTKKTGLTAQYLVEDDTMRNVRSEEAWSFTGGNTADRSAAYSVNLPFDTGAGPYSIWLNEADRAYTVTQVGQPFVEDGITVIRLQGHLDTTPVDPFYMRDLSRAGIPAGMTLHQLQAAATALGVDTGDSFPAMPASLSSDEVGTLLDPIPLDYTMTADASLLVEPRTGTIVSVERMDESFSGRLDPARLRALGAMLDKHRSSPGIPTALAAVDKLAAVPEGPVFDISSAQTPASVQKLSGYAASQRDWVNRMTRVIPTTLLAVGIGLVALGVVAGVLAWRRRNYAAVYWWEEEEDEE